MSGTLEFVRDGRGQTFARAHTLSPAAAPKRGAYCESVAPNDAPVDSQIHATLARARQEDWEALWAAVDVLAAETTFATWSGGEIVGTTIIDGEERPVRQMPYPVYSQSVEGVRERLGKLGLIIPFDWMSWDGLDRYTEDPAALATAPVTDAVRTLTAIQRAERFGDGNIEGALRSGLMQVALTRLRRWYEEERAEGSHGRV